MATAYFAFLGLPIEVRHMVYMSLLGDNIGSVFVHETARAADHIVTLHKPGLNLLKTCRAIYGEARQYADCKRLIFRTDMYYVGHEANLQLPKLGQQLAGSTFLNITTISVGVTDLWRVIGSLGSLKTRMANLKCVEVITIKRIPYKYWKEKFPTIVLLLHSSRGSCTQVSRACRSNAERGAIPDLELAKFRGHVRFHPLMNEDEHYIDDEEDGYDEDKGDATFARSADLVSKHGLELLVRGKWILVDRKANNAVQLIVETTFDIATGRILEAHCGHLDAQLISSDSTRFHEALVVLERQTVQDLHMMG